MATVSDVRLDRPVEIYPCKIVGATSYPMKGELFVFTPDQASIFIDELMALERLNLIEETLQGLAQRTDGTLLKTAFPNVSETYEVISEMNSLPSGFKEKLDEWISSGSNEISFNFEEKNHVK